MKLFELLSESCTKDPLLKMIFLSSIEFRIFLACSENGKDEFIQNLDSSELRVLWRSEILKGLDLVVAYWTITKNDNLSSLKDISLKDLLELEGDLFSQIRKDVEIYFNQSKLVIDSIAPFYKNYSSMMSNYNDFFSKLGFKKVAMIDPQIPNIHDKLFAANEMRHKWSNGSYFANNKNLQDLMNMTKFI